MSTYAWIITRDYDGDKDYPEGTNMNAKGVAGPSDATPEQIEKARTEGFVFRMKDDDGNIAYMGKLWCEDGEQPIAKRYEGRNDKPYYLTMGPSDDETACFGPLTDFGTPNYGCTELEYRCDDPDGNVDGGKPVKVWAGI